jgi:hypothetical protein
MKNLLLVFMVAFATAAHSKSDGNWWNATSDTARINYLIGYFDGASATAFYLPAIICMDQKRTGNDLEKCTEGAYYAAQKAVVAPIAGRPYGQFVTGLNTFYSDYRNLGICFKVAVNVVKSEMKGMKQESVRDWVEKVRALPVTDSCD